LSRVIQNNSGLGGKDMEKDKDKKLDELIRLLRKLLSGKSRNYYLRVYSITMQRMAMVIDLGLVTKLQE
jgi:hypothetical protein